MITNNCGIYKITNTLTGDFYIGSSIKLDERKHYHFRCLCNGNHFNSNLQCAYNKYGKDTFEFSVILLCDPENRFYYEKVLILGLKAAYNIAMYTMALTFVSEATRQKMRESWKYRPAMSSKSSMSDETRHRISEAHKGHVMSDETKHKISLAITGTHYSEERIRKMRDGRWPLHTGEIKHKNYKAHKVSKENKEKKEYNKGELNPFFGKHHTEEAKRKNSDAHKGALNPNFGKHRLDFYALSEYHPT